MDQPSAAPAAADALEAHPGVTRVRQALADRGAGGQVVVLDGSARTAAEAAAVLGVPVGAIVSSLVFLVPPADDAPGTDGPQPVLVLTSGAHRVDVEQVAAVLGVPTLLRAAPEVVREVTGSAIGGVAPLGHPAPLRTLVDVDLADHDVVWAAAGHPRAVFPTRYEELLRITGGQPVEVV